MANKVALIILDGWGLAGAGAGNAFTNAKTPTFGQLFEQYPSFALQAAGQSVGMPENSPGNSEAGHRALGTGQVTEMIASRLQHEITSGELWRRPALTEAWQSAKQNGKKIHLVGLLSDSTNHASLELLYSLIDSAKQFGYVNALYLHLFLDGRDTQLRSGQELLEKVYVYLQNQGYGSIATLCGRQFAMSRGGEDALVARAADLLLEGKGQIAKSPLEAVMDEYAHGRGDYNLEPTVCDPNGKIEAGDSVILFNHRADRQRPLVTALSGRLAECLTVATVPFEQPWPYRALYEPVVTEINLVSAVTTAGKKVTKITETDRAAHLTSFFNGGHEAPYYNEERVFIDSRLVKVTPEQSIDQLNKQVSTRLRQAAEDLLIVNVPNMDAAGHAGDLALAQAAVEAVDRTLADWLVAGADQWTFLITADHGNIEYLLDPQTNEIRPEDTASLVPILCVDQKVKGKGSNSYEQLAGQPAIGMLTDVTATVLAALDVPAPPEIAGVNLLEQT
jgi:2,3-bisphosphoglycerate-independent phosphoglycerate mutase